MSQRYYRQRTDQEMAALLREGATDDEIETTVRSPRYWTTRDFDTSRLSPLDAKCVGTASAARETSPARRSAKGALNKRPVRGDSKVSGWRSVVWPLGHCSGEKSRWMA